MTPTGTPLPSEPTGIERWQRSSAEVKAEYAERALTGKERWERSAAAVEAEYAIRSDILSIDIRLHEIGVEGTYRSSADLPVPDEYVDVAKDLRKGKASLGGATFRFFSLLFRRNHERADELSLEVCALICRRRDLMARLAGRVAAPATTDAPGSATATWQPIGGSNERSIEPGVMTEAEVMRVVGRRQKVNVMRPALATKAIQAAGQR